MTPTQTVIQLEEILEDWHLFTGALIPIIKSLPIWADNGGKFFA